MPSKKNRSKSNNTKPMTDEERQKIMARFNVTNGFVQSSVVKEDPIIEEKMFDVNVLENLKSPVVSFMGHVDAGKTSLMDCIRGTSIQSGEAGGITQSIGSSFVPIEHIREVTKNIKGKFSVEHNIPGILIVDTPGHSAFSSMRDRGSSLCDIAILVVDLNKGIQPQTEESIKMLRDKKVPFIIAGSKLDMIYDWQPSDEVNLRKSLKKQSESATNTLMGAIEDIKFDFSKLDIEAEFYFQNKTPNKTYSIVPISTKTNEGLSDLLSLIVYISQNWMSKKIVYKDTLDATVMESVLDPKLGWVIDVILSNGTVKVGDKLAVTTNNGSNLSTVRNIFIPPQLTQDRTKVNWRTETQVKASMGIRIIGSNLEGCMAGSSIFQVSESLDENSALEKATNEFEKFWKSFDWDSRGICLVAPTIGELDAAYNIMKEESIPISRGEISNFNKKVADRYSCTLEEEKNKENKVIMYFHSNKLTGKQEDDYVKICSDLGIHFIHNTVVYHLVDEYKKAKEKFLEERKKELSASGEAIFPCELQILKDHIYMKGGNDDLLFGVKVKAGRLIKGTPLVSDKKISLGRVVSIQKNHSEKDEAKLRDEVCIRVKNESNVSFGRQLDSKDMIISEITRNSIDELKANFRDDMAKSDWMLILDHMKKLGIGKT